ncbi:DUF3667 domain-containing protein [Filimonas effusa]|uniref:DUF3667 domain-containing protein n=1 Tax=Filimonas effusa TaxID=2508721 RepID=UPI001C705131|nr:DUF3667 domain-containing protein [Filimonas effusa]
MAHHNTLRQDKTCENCGHQVEEIFCPHCGQKNVETRQSFGHLIGHFIEDFTHYDTAFWKTIKFLLFRPARLTKEYLAGKRMSFVLPVKLYIFISFIAFFMLAIAQSRSRSAEAHETTHAVAATQHAPKKQFRFNGVKVNSAHELDSVVAANGYTQGGIFHWFIKKVYDVSQNNASGEHFSETFTHTVPKVLFLYMPLFAFWLWLVHGKKRWLFFDHGIFTLHYFSLLLLLTAIGATLEVLLSFVFNRTVVNEVGDITGNLIFLYACFYLFAAHKKMYQEGGWVSALKCLLLLLINTACIIVAVLLIIAYVLYSVH